VASTTDDYVPYLELAVQKSVDNPPAAWLWRPEAELAGKEVYVRVGGSFVWPPPGVDMAQIKRAVFIAGGVGIKWVDELGSRTSTSFFTDIPLVP